MRLLLRIAEYLASLTVASRFRVVYAFANVRPTRRGSPSAAWWQRS